jgi:hypothetical protein
MLLYYGGKKIYILANNTKILLYFIKYARKPQAFKPGEEWHLFCESIFS